MRRLAAGAAGAAGLSAVLLLSGCASTHLATSTARDGIGASVYSPSPTSTTSSPPPPSAPTSLPPSTGVTEKDFATIRRLMAARARAVIAGHEAAFMATLDVKRPAFLSAQRVMFANLQDLLVTSMRYEVGASGLTPALDIHGSAVLSPEVVEHVFITGPDRRAVANEVNDTFVKRGGHWRLAADTINVGSAGGVTARPWAGPRLEVVVRGNLVVVADASSPGRASAVADTVEADLTFDAGILDVPVDDHLLVDATSSGSVSKFDNAESAGAVTFAVGSGSNFEITRFAGMRVKLNPQLITQLLNDPVILRHELTHFLTFKGSGLIPKWLAEGLAEYVSHQPAGLSSEYLTPESYDRLMNRRQELTVAGLFGLDPATDYPLAMACVTYLVDHGGVGKVKDLMAAYAVHRGGVYGDEYTGHLLRRIYGLTPADVAHGAFDLLAALR